MTDPHEPLSRRQLDMLAALPADVPVVMLNQLRFRDRAAYPPEEAACSGREAYRRYSQVALQAISRIGGSVIFSGRPGASLIGPEDEVWHAVFLVRYPSVDAFRSMLAMPGYRAAVRHRTAAIEDSRLIPIMPAMADGFGLPARQSAGARAAANNGDHE